MAKKKRRDSYKNQLRDFMAAEFQKTRSALKLTQAQMAAELGIDVRSYSFLESRDYLCSTPVLLRYISKFKQIEIDSIDQDGKKATVPDVAFIQEVCRVLNSSDNRLV